MIIRFTPLLALAVLSACAKANPPTVSTSDVDHAYTEADAISRLHLTSTDELPTGSVTYRGQLGADVRGDAIGSILGDMTMDVDFARNDVDGAITNINLIDLDSTPNQRFDGELDVFGTENSGRINAFASGEITGVDNDGFEVHSQLRLDLNGDIHDDVGQGDAVYGTADGAATGDFYMDVNGVFFGTAE